MKKVNYIHCIKCNGVIEMPEEESTYISDLIAFSEDCLYRECKFYNENAFGGYCSNPKKCKIRLKSRGIKLKC